MSAVDNAHTAPPVYVTAPPRMAPGYGLFSVSTRIDAPELRFQNGIEWEGLACSPASSVSGVCFDPADLEVDGEGEGGVPGWPVVPREGVTTTVALPFAVYGSYKCSGVSRPLAEADLRARQHLALWEETEVERTIVSGDRDALPSLQGATDLTPGGGASLVDGFGILEAHIAENYASVGVIHMPRRLGAPASWRGLVDRKGQRLETLLGNYVAAGGGYDLADLGPDGAPPDEGSAWLYATSIPQIRRGEVFVIPDEEFRPQYTNNDLEIFAWRVYVVAWECISAAVQVDL